MLNTSPRYFQSILFIAFYTLFSVSLLSQTNQQPDLKSTSTFNQNKAQDPGVAAKAMALRGNGMGFTENKGQVVDMDLNPRPDILFKGAGAGTEVYLRKTGISYVSSNAGEVLHKAQEEAEAREHQAMKGGLKGEPFDKEKAKTELLRNQLFKYHRVDVDFLNSLSSDAPNAEIITADQVEGYVNYYLPQCPKGITHVNQYNEVTRKNVYKNIDVKYYGGKTQGLEYDIIVNPGADPKDIQLKYSGVDGLYIQHDRLYIKTSLGELEEHLPKVYQIINGRIADVEAHYLLGDISSEKGSVNVSFEIGAYDHNYPLIIDPWISYYGGNSFDEGIAVASDNSGNGVFTGDEFSSNFPVSAGAYQVVSHGTRNSFVIKMAGAGTRVWGTYFGGNGQDLGYGIAVDKNNNIDVCGITTSTTFPILTPAGAYVQANLSTYGTGFIAQFTSAGALTWSTYLGGSGSQSGGTDFPYDVCTDGSNNMYVTGYTLATDYPLMGAYQSTNNETNANLYTVMVTKFNSSGTMKWSTYYGGGGAYSLDRAQGITCDPSDNVYVAGYTNANNFPIVGTAYQSAPGGLLAMNAFLVKLNPSTGFPIWSTYLGGSNYDAGYAVACDNAGNVIIAGNAMSNNFPLKSAYQSTNKATTGTSRNAFISKFDGNCNLLWSTYFGGSGNHTYDLSEEIAGLAVDNSNNVIVSGDTYSSDFPVTSCAYQTTFYGPEDQFLSTFDPNGNILCSGYMGIGATHGNETWPAGGNISANGCSAWFTAYSFCTYPVTAGAFQTSCFGGVDAVMANLYLNNTNPVCCTLAASSATATANVSCNGGNNGTASVTISSGAGGPYAYSWSNGVTGATATTTATTISLTNLTSGTYTINVTEGSCSSSVTVTITQPSAINIASVTPTNTTCGSSNGSAVASASGGNGTLTYTWNNSVTGRTNSNLGAATYTVTVKDASGCTATSAVAIAGSTGASVFVFNTSTTMCSGSSNVLSVTGAVTYVWNPGGLAGASVTVSPTSPTTYTVTGTDAGGCTGTSTVLITVYSLPTVTASAGSSGICNGSNTTLTGGGASTYVWNPGALSGSPVSVSPSSPTTYTVTGTDGNGCKSTSTVVVNVNGLPSVTASASSSSICNGTNATLTAGGAATYVWNPGALSGSPVSVSPSSPTTYTVTGTDGNGCTSTSTAAITVHGLPTVTASASASVICNGTNTTLTGGGASTYVWNPGTLSGSPVSVSPSSPTTYTVTGTDGNGCTSTSTAAITVHSLPSVTASAGSPSICNGGSSTLTAGGATSYIWNPGSLSGSPVSVSPSSPTTYTVTGTDGNGCTSTSTAIVTVHALPAVTASATIPAVCPGGSSTLNAGGASTYVWNPGSLSGASVSVTPGAPTNYTVTGTDGNGCTSTSVATVTVNAQPIVTASATSPSICNGGSTTLNAGGATTYSWSPGALSGSSVSVSPSVPTTYTVTGSSGAGCSATSTVLVTVHSLPTVTASATSLTICSGTNTTLNAGGASTYVWNPGTLSGSSVSVSPGAPTTYTVTGTDANGCTAISTTAITVHGLPTITASATASTICNGSSTTLNAGGGISYSWNPGALSGSPVSVSPGSPTTYTVTGTDANGCTSTSTVAIAVTALPSVTATATSSSICSGGSTTLNAGGGTAYIWSPGGMSGSSVSVSPSSPTTYTVTGTTSGCSSTSTVAVNVNSLPPVNVSALTSGICNGGNTTLNASGATSYNWNPGALSGSSVLVSPTVPTTYTVTGTDGNGCTKTATAFINVSNPPSLSASNIDATCSLNNGSATVNVTVGSANYSYNWNTSASATTSSASNTITNLPGGNYTVTVTDGTGCSSSQTFVLNTTPAVTATTSSTDATCGSSNGSVSANVTSGTAGYTYSWTTTATSQTVSSLSSGSYTVTITDSKGCTTSAVQTINNAGAAAVSITASINITCNGGNDGSVTAAASGGIAPLTYSWSNAVTGTTSINGLTAGSYTLSVIDANGCLSSSNVTLTAPNAINPVTSSQTNATCGQNNGQAIVNVTGGTGAYTYSWSNSATGNTITGVGAGAYNLTVTDAKGCTGILTVNINNAGSPTATIASTSDLNCFNNNTGSASVNVTGGTPGYGYNWSGGGGAGQTATNLAAGTYVVTVTDANSCSATVSVSITEPAQLLASSAGATPATCGNANGTASVSAIGGTGSYTYSWSTTATSQTINNLPAGSYIVTVTDANGCTQTDTEIISDAPSANITVASAVNVLCYGSSTGSINVNVSGGTLPLTYDWSNSVSGVTGITGLTSGTYSITVTDANGCTSSSAIILTQPSAYSVSVSSTQQATCGQTNGGATVTATGGTAGYSYLWSNSATGTTISAVSAGTYYVTVTDAAGCTTTTSATINNLGAAIITLGTITDVACNGANTGSANISVSGGTGMLTYSWSNGSTGLTASNLPAGNYTVGVTDASGCFTSSIITINQPNVIGGTFTTSAAHCSSANGSATVTASGGIGAYTYSWSDAAGTTGVTASGLVSGIYTITITDANGCSNVLNTNVGSSGAATVVLSGAQTICIGQSATLSANVSGGVPSYTYSWSTGSTGPGPEVVSPGSTATYTLLVTDASGCVSTQQTVTVTVNPVIAVNVTATKTTACKGSAIIIIANASGGNGVYSYSWSPSGGNNDSITISANSGVTYSVTVSDNCGSPVAASTVAIVVDTPPTVSLSSDLAAGCGVPLCVNFTGSTSASCNSVKWDFGDTDTSANANPQHCYNSAGSFNVSLTCTDANGCSTTQTVSNMVTVNTKPVVGFSYSPEASIKQDSLVTFNNTTTGGNTYKWTFGDSSTTNTSILTNPTHSYTDTGNYCVKLIAYSTIGCVDSVTQCLRINEGCKLPANIPNVFSPNSDGMNDIFTIKSSGLTELICSLYNRWGMLIYEYDAVKTGWDGHTNSDSQAPAGTYYYILKATCTSNRQLNGNGFLELLR